MTKVTIFRNFKNECVGFDAFEHAGYAEEGEDIVCAAISVLTINTMNAIEGISLEEDIAKDILIKETVKYDDDENDEIVEEDGRLVNSFYTRSMDLSDKVCDKNIKRIETIMLFCKKWIATAWSTEFAI